jgi:rhamnogalacturonyl hydrolase YesR
MMNKRIGFVMVAAMLMAANVRAAEAYVVVPGGAVNGCKTYTDRDDVYQAIPAALQGADYVQMLIEDRFVATPSEPLLELTLSKPATVTVGVDSRGKEPLSWLNDWEKTGERALAAKHLKMELYSKAFPAGNVVLNGAKVKGAAAMYVVFATEGSVAGIKRIALAAPAKAAPKSSSSGYDRAADPHNFTVFMQESGYCWFQDPRVIVNDGKLIIGAIQGNGTGPAHVGVYDLDEKKQLGTTLMQDKFHRDDHNSPVFYVRPDHRILSVYVKHHKEKKFYYRISEPNNPLKWSEEMSYGTKARATYANLYEMKHEGKLYNFFRGIKFNPTFVTSTDGGETWGEETHFIASELNGTHRPYCRYASNGKDTVYISFTDGHPRNAGNSLYYAEFREGKFWKADGTLIKDLKIDGPLRPSEAEVIYQGPGTAQEKIYSAEDTSVENSAWTSSMVTDKNGYPHIGYSVHKTNKDHRYRIASWDGTKWHDREVAYGGSALYGYESSYTGLITLDPVDPTYVVISADVDPGTGKKKSTQEIYRAKIERADARGGQPWQQQAIRWEPLTWSSPVRNLRPIIVRDGDRRIVLWNRGFFSSYGNYQMDAVGFVESVAEKSPIAKPLSKEGMLEAMTLAKDFQERGGPLRQGWIQGTFYGGVFACYEATGNQAFLDAARKWTEKPFGTRHGVNADAICTAQTFLDVYRVDKDESLIAPIKKIFETEYFGVDVLEKKKIGHAIWKDESRPFIGRNLWWWCDALYMAPPVIARMGNATGDPRYFELLHKLYWDSVDYLYNPEAKLFFRDKNWFAKKTPSGKPVFWGRGNGWVIGGLVRTIDYIPENDPMREKYIQLFRDMMSRLITLQGDDGLWRASVNDLSWYPMPETSGSGFYVFGLAAGLNRGWLDRETYLPAAEKGWKGLVAVLSPEGKVQWSQGVAANPYATRKEHTRSYTQGTFLLAASEMYKLEGYPKMALKKEAAKTFARHVPERLDDFAWENDKVAFRAYGPKARKGAENSGIDCWLKRVETPIIDKWYGQMKTKSYHKDWGEGHDPYHVGSSAGCGGTGIWLNGKREPLETYTKQEVIECTTERTQFKLTYEREIDGDVYGEEKTVTIELGKRLFDVHSVFTKNGKVASNLPICIGLTTHDGKAETFSNEKQGWIACWEKIAGSEVGTAARVDPKRIVAIQEVQSDTKDESHHFIFMKTDRNGAIDYQAGYGWKKAGEIKTANDWNNYLNEK